MRDGRHQWRQYDSRIDWDGRHIWRQYDSRNDWDGRHKWRPYGVVGCAFMRTWEHQALNTGNPRWKVARTGEMRATASAEQLASTNIMLASSSSWGHCRSP